MKSNSRRSKLQSSRKVRINNLACEAQNAERQQPKHSIDQGVSAICAAHKRSFLEIVFSVFDFFFTRSKSTFELAQPLIRERCPAQVQPGEPICRTPLNRFPHYQVIGSQLLKSVIRSPELIYRFRAGVEKDRCRQRLLAQPCGCDKPM